MKSLVQACGMEHSVLAWPDPGFTILSLLERSHCLAGEIVEALGSFVGQCGHVCVQLLPAEGSSTLCVSNLHLRLANPQGFTKKESGCLRTALLFSGCQPWSESWQTFYILLDFGSSEILK